MSLPGTRKLLGDPYVLTKNEKVVGSLFHLNCLKCFWELATKGALTNAVGKGVLRFLQLL